MQWLTPIDDLDLSDAERGFVHEAMSLGDQLGEDSILLLTGSRATGDQHLWSDLDLWLSGDKSGLPSEEAAIYNRRQPLYIADRDIEAHVSFYDYGDLERCLASWPVEMIWILSHALPLGGDEMRFSAIRDRFVTMPDEVVETKLKQAFGSFLKIIHDAAREQVKILGLRDSIDIISRICCLAERRPYSYLKRREQAAMDTETGRILLSEIYEHSLMPGEIAVPAYEPELQLWITREAISAIGIQLTERLKTLNWSGPWLDDPMIAISYAYECDVNM